MPTQPGFLGLITGFVHSAQAFPDRPALEVNDHPYRYQELAEIAGNIAAGLRRHCGAEQRVAAVLAARSLTAYAGILGILGSGRGYVPLNPKFPIDRTRSMLRLSGVDTLVVGPEALPLLNELLADYPDSLTIICPEQSPDFKLTRHQLVDAEALRQLPGHSLLSEVDPEATAYLMFTSGSTGVPKGVPVSHRNALAYMHYIGERYEARETDRFSQTFDLTFDLSVHDMFVCWGAGACLCCVPERSVMAPAKFIRDKSLTFWFSVPSLIAFASKMRLLKPGCFPTLRYNLFCGEALPASAAAVWQEAAPNSVLENLYGPTEATIAISHYRWDPLKSPAACQNGIVPIGQVFPGHAACVIDEAQHRLPMGQPGELCLSGPQVTRGYLHNPEKTRQQFIHLPHIADTVWYRTGDLATQDASGSLHYLGRIDNQVKIRGFRVELQEVDHVLRKAAGSDLAIAIAWPLENGRADAIYGFVVNSHPRDEQQIIESCAAQLPEYMVPRRVFFLQEMPLNPNGKIDRGSLAKRLEATAHAQ